MSEIRELGQRYIAALWDAAHTVGSDPTAGHRLAGLVDAVTEAEAQLAGFRLHLLHEARLTGADIVVDQVRGSVRTTPAQATATIKLATDLADRFPIIAAALTDGAISLAQADAIVTGLRKLPGGLTRADLARCQTTILEYADTLGPTELRVLASRLVEVIDPDRADADDAARLAADERAARRNRWLRLTPDHHGSTRITGQLPVADAAVLSAQLEALMPPASAYSDAALTPTPDMRRADALIALTHTAATTGGLPAHGGDRPRVHITLDYHTLLTGLGKADLLTTTTHDRLTAGEARRLACDAGIIPIVLGGRSQPIDVGREQRTFPRAVRAALIERDRGCVFPGCTATPAQCEAHHIIPWWNQGPTSVHNGVLLCPYHHRLVEPDPLQSEQSQWQVHLDPDTDMPWFTPPRHIDPRQRPRQHTRHRLHHITPAETAPARAPDPPGSPDPDGPDLDDLINRTAHLWHPDQ